MPTLRIYCNLALPADVKQALQDGAKGHQLLYAQDGQNSALSDVASDPQMLEADIAFGQPNLEDVESAQNLKFIQISSSGITRYDNAAFRKLVSQKGIAVCNSAQVFNEPCAVHALAFMLAHARQLDRALASHAAPGSDDWYNARNATTDLRGQTAVIVGYGAIGSRLAELLQPFRMNLYACRRSPRGNEAAKAITIQELDTVLPDCHHVINTLPHSPETTRFFDEPRFARFKQGSVFYNIGRGSTVDQDALLSSLESGQLAAAWLDVTEPEPLPADHPLRHHPNCRITPHIAGGHPNEMLTIVQHFLANLRRFEQGAPLADQVM